MSVSYVCLVIAFICFILSTVGVPAKFNLTSLGLALWVLAAIIGNSKGGLLWP